MGETDYLLVTNSFYSFLIGLMYKSEEMKKGPHFCNPFVFMGGRSVSNRRPPEPQSGALTN